MNRLGYHSLQALGVRLWPFSQLSFSISLFPNGAQTEEP
jgi:hypothetical protein